MSEHTPTTEQVRGGYVYAQAKFQRKQHSADPKDEFDRWLAAERARIWREGYRQGIEDERTAEALQVDIGVDGYATPNRANPYRVRY